MDRTLIVAKLKTRGPSGIAEVFGQSDATDGRNLFLRALSHNHKVA